MARRALISRKGPDGKRLPEYRIWQQMIDRCTNPNNPSFRHYGGRGVSVCARWMKSFEDFLVDVGCRPYQAKPRQWFIDRIDNDGNYEPGNVRWATPSQSAMNQRRRGKYCDSSGNPTPIRVLAERNGIPLATVRSRLKKGVPIKEACTTPSSPRGGRRNVSIIEAFGKRQCLIDWAREIGAKPTSLADRLAKMSPEEAMGRPFRSYRRRVEK